MIAALAVLLAGTALGLTFIPKIGDYFLGSPQNPFGSQPDNTRVSQGQNYSSPTEQKASEITSEAETCLGKLKDFPFPADSRNITTNIPASGIFSEIVFFVPTNSGDIVEWYKDDVFSKRGWRLVEENRYRLKDQSRESFCNGFPSDCPKTIAIFEKDAKWAYIDTHCGSSKCNICKCAAPSDEKRIQLGCSNSKPDKSYPITSGDWAHF